jgi:actin-related protein
MIIGKPKAPGLLVGMDQKDCYVGHEAKAKKNLLITEEPVQRGIIVNIDSI